MLIMDMGLSVATAMTSLVVTLSVLPCVCFGVRVPLVPHLVAIVCDSDSDGDLLNRNYILDAVGSVSSGADNLTSSRSVDFLLSWGGCNKGSSRSSEYAGNNARNDCGSGGGLNIVDGDTTWALRAGRRIALSGYRSDAGEDGGSSGLVWGSRLKRVRVARTILDRNVSAKSLGGASTVVVIEGFGHLLDLALVCLGIALEAGREDGAVLNATGEVGALGDGGLEGVDVPAVHEVAVVAVA
jgi:hypothetical protein